MDVPLSNSIYEPEKIITRVCGTLIHAIMARKGCWHLESNNYTIAATPTFRITVAIEQSILWWYNAGFDLISA